MMGYGVYRSGSTTDDWFGGLWYVVLGWMLGGAARAAVAQSHFATRLEGVTAGDIMDAEPVVIPAAIPVDARVRRVLPALPGLAVVRGRRGRRRASSASPTAPRSSTPRSTRTARRRSATSSPTATRSRMDTPLESLIGSEPLRRLGALMAVDADGRLRGVVTLEQVSRALQARLAPS